MTTTTVTLEHDPYGETTLRLHGIDYIVTENGVEGAYGSLHGEVAEKVRQLVNALAWLEGN